MIHKSMIEESLKRHDRLAREYFRKSMIASLKGMIDTSFTYAQLAKFHGEFRENYDAIRVCFGEACRDILELNLDRNANRFEVNVEYRPKVFTVTLGRL